MKKTTLIIVLGMISLLVIGNTLAQGMKDRNRDQLRDRIHERLNLTDEQQAKIDDLRLKHQKEMIDLNADVKKKELELKELMLKGNYSRDEFLSETNDRISAKNKIAIAKANHRMDVYELLDPEQKAEWNKIGMKMHERMELGPRHFPKHLREFGPNRDFDLE